jgi:P pilus assembly chaperone PapD
MATTRLAFALLCALIGTSAASLDAQLTVSRLDITVTPSETNRVMASFVVRNVGTTAAQGIVTREDWDRAENGDNQFMPSGSTSNSCGNLISVFPVAFRLEPAGEQTVRVAIEKVANAAKECWEIVFVQDVPQKRAPTQSGLEYTLRTGVKLYVAPAGLTRDGAVTHMSVAEGARASAPTRSPISPRAKERITIQFTSSGELHLAAKGRIEIRRLDNSTVMDLDIPEFPTLPGAVRRLEVDIPPALPPGKYVALAMIDFGSRDIAAGHLELTIR